MVAMAGGAKRSFSSADLAALMERAIDEDGAIIIKRPGRKDMVILPFEQFREMDTTTYLLASPKNRKRLLGALRDARKGRGRKMSVSNLRKQIGLDT